MNYDYALSINSTGVNLLCLVEQVTHMQNPYVEVWVQGCPKTTPSVLFPHTLSQSSCQLSIFLYGNLSLPVKKLKKQNT